MTIIYLALELIFGTASERDLPIGFWERPTTWTTSATEWDMPYHLLVKAYFALCLIWPRN